MTSNFDARKDFGQEAAREMDSLQRDRFELLSAYIDGEVTATERYQVQELLATDADMKHLYVRLQKLRQGLQTLPVPPAEVTAQETARQVFSRIQRRRIRRVATWGGAAIAALFVGAISGVLPGSQPWGQQWAESTTESEMASDAPEPLMIAVNQPVIEIPKAPVASPEKGLESGELNEEAEENQLN